MNDANPPEIHEESAKVRMQLSLTKDSIKQGEALKKILRRPSFSNVVEALIGEEFQRQEAANGPTQAKQEAA